MAAQESARTCLNCGRPAGPRYCGSCGQPLDDRRSPLLALLRELLEEWLALDGRLIRTVVALPRPGRLTRLYLDGKRAPFLGPLRLYLLASLALFSSVLALTAPDANEINLSVAGQMVTGPAVPGRPNLRIMEDDSAMMQWANRRWGDKMARLRARPPQELLDRLFAGLRSALPVALILFLPFLAMALKVLFIDWRLAVARLKPDTTRRARGRPMGPLYVDHLIFGVHFQSALFVALGVVWLLTRLAGLQFFWSFLTYVIVWLLMLTVYLSRALRRVYGGAWWATSARTGVLVLSYLTLLQPVIGGAVLLVLWRL